MIRIVTLDASLELQFLDMNSVFYYLCHRVTREVNRLRIMMT